MPPLPRGRPRCPSARRSPPSDARGQGRGRSRRALSAAARRPAGERPGVSRRHVRAGRRPPRCAPSSVTLSSRDFRPRRIEVSAWPVSSWSSRASRSRSCSCAATTPRRASRATRSDRSTARAARVANVSASRRSSSEKRASRPSLSCAAMTPMASSRAIRGTHKPVLAEIAACDVVVDLRVVEDGVAALAPAALEDAAALRPVPRRHAADELGRTLAGGGGETQLVRPARQRDGHEPGAEQLPQPPADEIEQPVEVGLGRKGVADLVQRLELARPPRCCLVEPGVLDRDSRLTGQQRHELLVLFGEGLAAGLLGQVEIAVGHAAEQDRHAEERAHRRVTGRESDRSSDPGRGRAGAEECASWINAPRMPRPRGRSPIDRLRVRIDAGGQEALELRAARVDDAERRVARAGQLRRELDDALQQRVERELGGQRDPGLEQGP